MDSFLQSLYNAEMSKQATANLDEFMHTLEVSDLEAVLGLTQPEDMRKQAVAGPAEAPLPSCCPTGHMDAKMKEIAANLNRARQGEQQKKPSGGDHNLSYQGVGLPTSGTTKKAEDCAVEAGRVFAKTAGMGQGLLDAGKKVGRIPHLRDALVGGTIGTAVGVHHIAKKKEADMDVEQAGSAYNQKMAASRSDLITPEDHVATNIGILRALTDTPQGPGGKISPELLSRAKKNALKGGLLGGGVGALLGLGGSYAGGRRGVGAVPGTLAGLLYGGGLGAVAGDMGTTRKWAKERGIHPGFFGGAKFTPEAAARYLDPVPADKVAEARASLVATALSATKGAPEHIKEAAAKLVAEDMAKIAFLPAGIGALIGASRAPKGERSRGAVRGALTGLGADVGVGAGSLPALALARHLASKGAVTPAQSAALATLGALGVVGGGYFGGRIGHKMGRKIAPYNHEMQNQK